MHANERGYVSIRSYYPTQSPLNYENVYLSSTLHYTPAQNVTLHVSLLKGQGEPGYFPAGYFGDSGGGLYEQGTYYVSIEDTFHLEKLILGNYVPLFGQGLLFGGIHDLILSNPYYNLARHRDGIYPSGSTSKNTLLEGIALEYVRNNIAIRPFFSWNSYDCSAGESDYFKYNDNDWQDGTNDEDDDNFTGFEERFGRKYSCKTNLFTCIRGDSDYGEESDRLKRNNLVEYLGGVNLSIQGRDMDAGSTLAYTRFNRLIDPYYNFKEGEGDKTGHWFRGRDFVSSNIYFKLYQPLEIFGEIAGTFARSLSYYPEFNGDFVSAVGFSGGMRDKIRDTGLILWGAYLPPHLINPHGLGLPDGCNNLACGLLGMHRTKKGRQLTSWVYVHSELYNEDDPGDEEAGIEGSYVLKHPWGAATVLKIDQSLEATYSHYYAPSVWSSRISSKASVKHQLSKKVSITFRFENRTGGPEGDRIKTGTGISGELYVKRKRGTTSVSLMGFSTSADRFAYLYPYERPLYSWSFVPQAVYGNGFLSSVTMLQDFGELTLGTKLRWILDVSGVRDHSLNIYGLSEYRF